MAKFSNASNAIHAIQRNTDEQIKELEDDLLEGSTDLFIVKDGSLIYKSRLGNTEFLVEKIGYKTVRDRVDWTIEVSLFEKLLDRKVEVYLDSLKERTVKDGENLFLELSSEIPYRRSQSSFSSRIEKILKDFAWKEDRWIRPVKNEKEAEKIVKKVKSLSG